MYIQESSFCNLWYPPEYLEFYLLISFFSQLGSLQCCSTLSIEMSPKFKILVTISFLVLTLNVFSPQIGSGARRLEECAHFHYEFAEIGPLQVRGRPQCSH